MFLPCAKCQRVPTLPPVCVTDGDFLSLLQWSSLRTCWRKVLKPVTLPCWVWVTSSSQVSSSPFCCASMSGNTTSSQVLSLFLTAFFYLFACFLLHCLGPWQRWVKCYLRSQYRTFLLTFYLYHMHNPVLGCCLLCVEELSSLIRGSSRNTVFSDPLISLFALCKVVIKCI